MVKPKNGIACFAPAEVFALINNATKGEVSVVVGDKIYLVKTGSSRYNCFKRDRCCCVCCSLMGTQMWLEKNCGSPNMPEGSAIFNLYGEEIGELVLFTRDHRIPRSRGGKDILYNLQTMCLVCNQIKADRNLNLDQVLLIRRLIMRNEKYTTN